MGLRHKAAVLLLLLALAAASSVAVWRAEFNVRPELNQKEILTGDVSLFDVSHVVVQGYSITQNRYEVMDGERDPKFIFQNISMPIQSIEIIFCNKLSGNAQLTIYHLDDKGEFSDDSTITVWGDNTISDFIFNLPQTTTAILRVDINADFVLQDIRVSSSPSVMVDQQEPPFSKKLLVMLIAVNFLLFAAIYYKRNTL